MIKTKKATKGNLLIIYKLQFLIGTIKTAPRLNKYLRQDRR